MRECEGFISKHARLSEEYDLLVEKNIGEVSNCVESLGGVIKNIKTDLEHLTLLGFS